MVEVLSSQVIVSVCVVTPLASASSIYIDVEEAEVPKLNLNSYVIALNKDQNHTII